MLDTDADRTLHMDSGRANVWMFVGVNGVGKPRRSASSRRNACGRTPGRARRGRHVPRRRRRQLGMWPNAPCELVRVRKARPGSVVFDAMAAASGRGVDLVLVDTAGRLHTKSNLMEELKKLRRIVDRTPDASKE